MINIMKNLIRVTFAIGVGNYLHLRSYYSCGSLITERLGTTIRVSQVTTNGTKKMDNRVLDNHNDFVDLRHNTNRQMIFTTYL